MKKLKRIEDLEVQGIRRYVHGGRLAKETEFVGGAEVVVFEDRRLTALGNAQDYAEALARQIGRSIDGLATADDLLRFVTLIEVELRLAKVEETK